MATPSYSIDSFHINIGTGDSAIHLLVKNPDKDSPILADPPPANAPTILRATLIDGGKQRAKPRKGATSSPVASANAPENIKAAIKEIKQRYVMGERGSDKKEDDYMRFDSIVVSHWDSDHYGGIVSLIQHDFEDQLKRIATTGPARKTELESKSCRYFLYANPADKTIVNGLRTTFYAPYWNKTYKDPPKTDNPDELEMVPGSTPGATPTLRFMYKGTKKFRAQIDHLCEIRCTPEDIIGSNILDNRKLTASYTTIKTAGELVDEMNGTEIVPKGSGYAPVGIYCVASTCCVMGLDNPILVLSKLLTNCTTQRRQQLIVDDDSISISNKASIANLVIWNEPKIEISHYFAGDSWYEMENAVREWTQRGPGGTTVVRKVRNMKLSHHGGQGSTPTQLLDVFDPYNIIISAGTDHAHPSWLTLFYINAWMIINDKPPGAVYATRYPYYGNKVLEPSAATLGKRTHTGKPAPKNPPQMFSHWDYAQGHTPAKKDLKAGWKALEKLYDSLAVPPDLAPWIRPQNQANEWYKRIKDPRFQKSEETVRWFVDQVWKAWRDNLSLLDAPPEPSPTAGWDSHLDEKSVAAGRDICYIWVQSLQTVSTTAVEHSIGVLYRTDTTGSKVLECRNRPTASTLAAHSAGSKVMPKSGTSSRQLYPDVTWTLCDPLPKGFRRPGPMSVVGVDGIIASPPTAKEILDSPVSLPRRPKEQTEMEHIKLTELPARLPVGEESVETPVALPLVLVEEQERGREEDTPASDNTRRLASDAQASDGHDDTHRSEATERINTGEIGGSENQNGSVNQNPSTDAGSSDPQDTCTHQSESTNTDADKQTSTSNTQAKSHEENYSNDNSIAKVPGNRTNTGEGIPLLPIPIMPEDPLHPAPPAPPDADQAFWIGTKADSDTEVPTDPTIKFFLTQLHLRAFGLQAKPKSKEKASFIAEEEWNSWFADVLDTVAPIEMMADDQLQPSSFNFAMMLMKKDTLKFDTMSIYKAFKIEQAKQPKFGLPDGTLIIFGLNTDKPTRVTASLTDLLKFSHQDHLANNPLIATLGSAINLDLATEDGSRNAIWFEPGNAYRVTQRLQWDVPTDAINKFFRDCGVKIELKDTAIITRRTTSWRPGPKMISAGSIAFQSTVSIGSSSNLDLTSTITLGENSLSISIIATKSAWQEFVEWITTVLATAAGDMTLISDTLNDLGAFIGKFIAPRSVSFSFHRTGQKTTLRSWSIGVELSVKSVPILVSYDSASKMLRGKLWLVSATESPLLLPYYESGLDLKPLTANYKVPMLLTDLSDSITEADLPRGIPNAIGHAEIIVDTANKGISFSASLDTVPSKGDAGNVPPIYLDTFDLCVTYTKADGLDILLEFEVVIGGQPQPSGGDAVVELDEEDTDDGNGATITGGISFTSKDTSWLLYGSIEALSFDMMYDLLDPDASDDVSAMLSHFAIADLEIEYQYGGGGKGSSFDIAGKLLLGPLALEMSYHYEKDGWLVKADLKTIDDNNITLGDIIDDLTGNHGDDGDILPDFILGIPLTAGSKENIITVRCAKHAKSNGKPTTPDTPRDQSYLLFQAEVHISIFTIGFTHYRDLSVTSSKPIPPKRVFKLYMNGIPPVPVPTLGQLPQPFDEIAFVYIQDKATDVNKSLVPGLTADDVKIINDGMRDAKSGEGGDWLMFRDTRKPGSGSSDTVMPAGAHFIIIMKSGNERKAILDYTLGRNKKSQSQNNAERALDIAAAASGGQNGKSSMAAMKKTVGPISLANIGLKYENKKLSVLLDASFLLGPVGFTFIEARISIDLGKNILKDFTITDVSFGLSGLAVAFDQPPVRLGGIFVYKDTEDIKYFAGGIVVGIDPYQFIAAGMYGHVKKPTEYDTAFVFAKLEGPLVTLEFAEISGITGGFGYNNDVKLPTIETVRQFPFLSGAIDASGSLLDFLGNLVRIDGQGSFSPKKDAMWLAAGLKVSALEMIDIDAVFVLSWNPAISIGIFGVGTANIPKTKKGGRTFAHVELGILAVIDFGAGVFKVEMQLAPSSYVFDPSCRLTGGFALYYWFNDKVPDRKGEWVFTIGGFHRSFKRPDYYPNPPRLGIHWQVSNAISIVGEAYFAVTPKSCMGGGRLQATLTAGPLRAWFSAWADFLINYMPFDFTGQVGVSVGISCKVDLLLTSFTVQTSIGAQLDLLGPPLRGRVKVDFWVISFHVNFGPDASKGSLPNLDGFYNMVLQAGSPESMASSFLTAAAPARQSILASDEKKPHVFTCRGGMLENAKKLDSVETKEAEVWRVKANEFAFAIDCRFALTYATISLPNEYGTPKELKPWESSAQGKLYAKPMQLTDEITSNLSIDVQPVVEATMFVEEEDRQADENWRVTENIKEVPSALWGPYDRSQNPRETGNNNIGGLLNGAKGTLPKLMGLHILPPKPYLANDKIGVFDAIEAMKQSVFERKDCPKFIGYENGDTNLYPAGRAKNTYEDIKTLWKADYGTKREDILDALWDGLGWNDTKGKMKPKEDDKPPQKLTAATPERLVDALGSIIFIITKTRLAQGRCDVVPLNHSRISPGSLGAHAHLRRSRITLVSKLPIHAQLLLSEPLSNPDQSIDDAEDDKNGSENSKSVGGNHLTAATASGVQERVHVKALGRVGEVREAEVGGEHNQDPEQMNPEHRLGSRDEDLEEGKGAIEPVLRDIRPSFDLGVEPRSAEEHDPVDDGDQEGICDNRRVVQRVKGLEEAREGLQRGASAEGIEECVEGGDKEVERDPPKRQNSEVGEGLLCLCAAVAIMRTRVSNEEQTGNQGVYSLFLGLATNASRSIRGQGRGENGHVNDFHLR
ncbi:unnamed protein product [Clonostachys rosea]|uniref:DUF6603 domain-containing protein n=1 Tax=Bionectria ochroleuca TaxID=29856 RepID=A0ABY6U2Y7_BIOOC|nr:unnamed protein product [Clonostachys rosea]